MPRASTLLTLLALFAPLHAASAQQQPYAGLERRVAKALSDQQLADLRTGRGMGLALPAELNGYPGPVHVLENADRLDLSLTQLERTQTLFEAMKAEAVPLGERLIEQEAELERLFATKAINPASLEGMTATIAKTQGALRASHLRYHLAMMDVLAPEQVRRYAELRGYGILHSTPGYAHGAGHSR
jgi:Spy/CpxP family protein refolding chaperone